MSDAQYAIDIAVAMPAGAPTIAQLGELVAKLTGAGTSADHFHDALAQVSNSLDVAKAASLAANAALAEGNAQYAELEASAIKAAKAAEQAALKGKLSPEMSRTAFEAASAVDAYSKILRELETSSASAAAKQQSLATAQNNLKTLARETGAAQAKAAAEAARATREQATAQDLAARKSVKEAEAMVPLVKNFRDLGDAMGTTEGAAILAIGAFAAAAAALVALTAVVVAATLAFAAYAIGLADTKRSAALAQEAFESMTPGAEGLGPIFRDVSRATGQTSADLQGLTKQLIAAKVSAEDMPDALHAAALAEAALGKGGSADFIANIKKGKESVNALSQTVQAKLGGIVAKQMRGLDGQSAQLKKNFGELFGGLNIEPVLAGLERLVALFDQNTAAGEAIKFLFESVFQPLIDQAENAALVIEAFALGFLIGLTKVYIAIKPAMNAITQFFGFKDTSLSDILGLATKAGEYAAYLFVGFIGTLALLGAAFVAVIAPIIAVQAAIYALIAGVIYAGVQIVQGIIGAWDAVKAYLNGLVGGLGDLAGNIMQGLITGILGSGPALVNALTGVVGSGIDAAKKLLGIASPSKVFAEIGGYTGEGFAMGVEDTAPDAQAAMTDMVDPPAPAAGKGAAAGEGKGGALVHIENLYLAGAKASKAETESLAEALTRLIEGDVAALGGEPAPA